MKEMKMPQMAAAMFTSIVEFAALVEEDEQVITKARARHREVFEQQHELHRGEIIPYYGDGTFIVFKSAFVAAKCAIEIQNLLREGNAVPLRIGLHVVRLVFNQAEAYGDAVNIASLLESMCVPGAVLLSGKFNDELKNDPAISTISLGHFELKNVADPVEVFAITNEGIKVPLATELKGKQKKINKTIAVLPFVNISTSKENEYFSDGITEEIINALSKIKSLRVTSRTSSFYFKNKNIPIRQIGTKLNVSAILEGSVRLAGDTLRITAQLIQVENDFHFWSETWDRKLENIFEIQDEISLLIAEKLREHLGHFQIQEHLVKKQTDNYSTYKLFLKARYHFRKWNPDDVTTAMGLYGKALKLDSNHAESILGLADCYKFLAASGFIPTEEAWERFAELIYKGLEINDQLPATHYQLANLHFFTACDYPGALKATLKSIELNPNYVEAQQFLAFLYIIAGEKGKALQHLKIALNIDPLSQETLFFSAYFDYMSEDYVASLAKANRCLAQNPKNIPAHTLKCYCLLKLSRPDEVLIYFDQVPPEIVVADDKLGITTLAYILKNDVENAAKYLKQLTEIALTPRGFRANSFLLFIYAVSGEKEKAFKWISDAIENKFPFLLIHFVDPFVDLLKTDPRHAQFKKIIFPAIEIQEIKKNKKPLLDTNGIAKFTGRLNNHIHEQKPYLDPDLSLRMLAEQIEIHPNQLSWLLNERIGKNFSDFINYYRVDTFKILSKDPRNAHLTLMGLAYDSGFNSKTVFNTYFKKETGLTPKQFIGQKV